MIVAFEGIDACGKSTQIESLKAEAERRGLITEMIKFPNYLTPTGKMLRENLTGEWAPMRGIVYDAQLGNYVRQCLMTTDKLEHQPRIASFKDDPKKLLILDRYWVSGLVYGTQEGLDRQWLINLHQTMIQPDRWILFDISVAESFRRRPERQDNYEKNHDLLRGVRQRYLDEFVKLSTGTGWYIIRAERPVEDVHAEVCRAVWK
jgi:dTMP kinase